MTKTLKKTKPKKKESPPPLLKHERIIDGKKIDLRETIEEIPKSPLLRYNVSGGGEIVR
jgi:hypothetical protein